MHVGSSSKIYWFSIFGYTHVILLSLSVLFQTLDRIFLIKRPYTYNTISRKKLLYILLITYGILASVIYLTFLSTFNNPESKKFFVIILFSVIKFLQFLLNYTFIY